jgi:hypothetical protein
MVVESPARLTGRSQKAEGFSLTLTRLRLRQQPRMLRGCGKSCDSSEKTPALGCVAAGSSGCLLAKNFGV